MMFRRGPAIDDYHVFACLHHGIQFFRSNTWRIRGIYRFTECFRWHVDTLEDFVTGARQAALPPSRIEISLYPMPSRRRAAFCAVPSAASISAMRS